MGPSAAKRIAPVVTWKRASGVVSGSRNAPFAAGLDGEKLPEGCGPNLVMFI